jgi:hypothetical protein
VAGGVDVRVGAGVAKGDVVGDGLGVTAGEGAGGPTTAGQAKDSRT